MYHYCINMIYKLESTLPGIAFTQVSFVIGRFSINSFVIIWLQLWSHPYPRDHDFRMRPLKFQLFLLIGSSYKFLCKNLPPPIVAHPTSGDHDFNKLESTFSRNASGQVTAFLANLFLRSFLKILFYSHLLKFDSY